MTAAAPHRGPALPGMRTILSAIENASTIPVMPDLVLGMLRGRSGHPSHLRALFGDVGLATLERVTGAAGIATAKWVAAYARARIDVAAANPEIDALMADGTVAPTAADHAGIGFTGPEPT